MVITEPLSDKIYIHTASHRRDTEVNNCFTIFKNIEIIEHKKDGF